MRYKSGLNQRRHVIGYISFERTPLKPPLIDCMITIIKSILLPTQYTEIIVKTCSGFAQQFYKSSIYHNEP
jgi:hypothetical protein